MARYIGPKAKIVRKFGENIFGNSKYDKILSKKSSAPRKQGRSRRKLSDYGLRLREKQKVKLTYGVLEKQFKRYYQIAARKKGVTGEILLQLLERRLDNVVFKLCFGKSMNEARQLVNHGHILVNNRKVDTPSFSVKVGDIIQVKAREKIQKLAEENIELVKERGVPEWIEADHKNLNGKVRRLPERKDIQLPIKEQLIVEYYSK